MDTEAAVGSLAAYGTRLFLIYPALFVIVSWLRGLLISRHATTAVNIGMLANLLITAIVLVIGVTGNYHGITIAAVALNAAIIAEVSYLLWRTQQVLDAGPIFGTAREWIPATVEARWRNRHD